MISPKVTVVFVMSLCSAPCILWLMTLLFLACDQFGTQRGQDDVLTRRKTADGHSADHLAVSPHRNAAAPSYKLGITEVGDIVALLRVPHPVSDILGRLAFPRGGPGLVGSDADGGDRGAIHAGEGNQFAVGVGHGNDSGLLLMQRLFDDPVDDLFGFGIINGLGGFHWLSLSRQANERNGL